MRKWRVSFTAAVAVMTVFLVPVSARAHAVTLPRVTVVAIGLNNPRGLAFSENGALYVAEGGTGGTASTVGQCTQVVPPIGPYTEGSRPASPGSPAREPGPWWHPGCRLARPPRR